MKRVPYGESNYKRIIDDNMYFIDKTKYIEVLEHMPSYQFFIRPRRFGKSLFLNMLQTYYDINEKPILNNILVINILAKIRQVQQTRILFYDLVLPEWLLIWGKRIL